MSFTHQSGPVAVFLGFGVSPKYQINIETENSDSENPLIVKKTQVGQKPKNISFLGYGKMGLASEIRAEWLPIHTDTAGGKVPDDLVHASQHAYTHVELVRWNERVLQFAQNRPYSFVGSPGANVRTDIGKMMLRQGLGLTLYLAFFRKDNKVQAGVDSLQGLRFPFNTVLYSPDIRHVGSQVNRVSLLFYSIPKYSPKFKQLVLYDYELDDLNSFSGHGGPGPNLSRLQQDVAR